MIGSGARPGTRRVLAVLASVSIAGCAAQPARPPLPAGIAELQLPASSTTLRGIAGSEESSGALDQRRELLAGIARQLLMAPPGDVFVPELFDFLVALAPRMESGAVSAAWGSYLYTTYQRELLEERPAGRPRRPAVEIEPVLDGYVEYFSLRADPNDPRPDPAADAFEAVRSWRDEQRIGR